MSDEVDEISEAMRTFADIVKAYRPEGDGSFCLIKDGNQLSVCFFDQLGSGASRRVDPIYEDMAYAGGITATKHVETRLNISIIAATGDEPYIMIDTLHTR